MVKYHFYQRFFLYFVIVCHFCQRFLPLVCGSGILYFRFNLYKKSRNISNMRKLDRKLLPVSHAALHPKVSVLAKFSVLTRRTVSKDHRLSFLFPNLRSSLCLSWKLLGLSKLMFSCKVILPRAFSSLGKFSTDWLNFELTRQKLHAGLWQT